MCIHSYGDHDIINLLKSTWFEPTDRNDIGSDYFLQVAVKRTVYILYLS